MTHDLMGISNGWWMWGPTPAKNVTTRERGVIPGCTPPSPPLQQNISLIQRYNLSVNDPQWVHEMCARIDARTLRLEGLIKGG